MSHIRDQGSGILAPINMSLGLGGGLAVGSATTALGGSWLAIPMCALFGIATGKLFAANVLNNVFWQTPMVFLRRLRFMPRLVRVLIAMILVGAVTAIDAMSETIDVPLGFYLYIFPIFASSVLLGRRASIMALLLSLPAVAYFVIPPRYSFSFETTWDAVCLVIFAVLAMIVLLVIGTLSDLSGVNKRPSGHSPVAFASSGQVAELDSEVTGYLRAESHHLTRIARACSDVGIARELEGISIGLMERAAELERYFVYRPSASD